MTLSPTQLDLLRKMRDGWELRLGSMPFLRAPDAAGDSASLRLGHPTLWALLDRGAIRTRPWTKGHSHYEYTLTPAGLAALEAAEK